MFAASPLKSCCHFSDNSLECYETPNQGSRTLEPRNSSKKAENILPVALSQIHFAKLKNTKNCWKCSNNGLFGLLVILEFSESNLGLGVGRFLFFFFFRGIFGLRGSDPYWL